MSENPVLNRLIGHNQQPSLRMTIIGGVILLTISAVGAALWMSASPRLLADSVTSDFEADALTWGSGSVFAPASAASGAYQLSLVLLIVTALVMASYLMFQEVRSEAFLLLQTTQLQPRTIAEGVMAATLFRLSIPLAVTIALMPLMFVWAYQKDFAVARYGCLKFVPADTVDVRQVTDPCVSPDDPRILWTWLGQLPGNVNLMGVIVLAAALGASLTLWLRSVWKTMAVIVCAIGLIVVALLMIGPGSDFRFIASCMLACTRMTPWPPVTIVDGILLPLIPFGLAWVAIRFARYRAPR